jgi:hypothetical protein
MLGVVFEVIQPDVEINRRHAAIPPDSRYSEQCARRFGQFYGAIRANSGSGTAAEPGPGYDAGRRNLTFAFCIALRCAIENPAYLTIRRPMS